MYKKFSVGKLLRFAIKDARISKLLRDASFSRRPGKLFSGLKTLLTDFLKNAI